MAFFGGVGRAGHVASTDSGGAHTHYPEAHRRENADRVASISPKVVGEGEEGAGKGMEEGCGKGMRLDASGEGFTKGGMGAVRHGRRCKAERIGFGIGSGRSFEGVRASDATESLGGGKEAQVPYGHLALVTRVMRIQSKIGVYRVPRVRGPPQRCRQSWQGVVSARTSCN